MSWMMSERLRMQLCYLFELLPFLIRSCNGKYLFLLASIFLRRLRKSDTTMSRFTRFSCLSRRNQRLSLDRTPVNSAAMLKKYCAFFLLFSSSFKSSSSFIWSSMLNCCCSFLPSSPMV